MDIENKDFIAVALEKKLNKISYVISAIVLILIVLMRKIKIQSNIDFSFLQGFHSIINGLTAFVLIFAFVQIKRRNIDLHRKSIYVAMILSALFLLSYVVYHFTNEEMYYCGKGIMRYIYFFILITHVILAACILPFVLITFNRAYTNQFTRHKKIARIVFPLWLYVAITGPICYLILYSNPC